KPTLWNLAPQFGLLDNVHRQGAGLLDIEDAILATVDVTPGKLSLGESEAGPQTRQLTFRNRGADAVTLDLSSVNALSTGPKNPADFTVVGYFFSNASASFSADSVTVQPGKSATVDVTITPSTGPNQGQYGGYIVASDEAGGWVYRVPFAGFIGDYQTVEVLTPSALFPDPAAGFPWLAQLVGTSFFNRPDGATYTMEGDDVPFFLVHLDHQSRYYEFRATDAATGKPLHPVFTNFDQGEYVGRNTTARGFFVFAWDGTRTHSAGPSNLHKFVENGDYIVELRVLKALGDPNNPDHWESWTSPTVTIARP
ncbi:MAG TPA: Fn3-like domain-containing protein, partial [Gammaproteobacteria bacterium]|nr:Fn3-like domain-containing protein [Gammaproteobacteria bacterium]